MRAYGPASLRGRPRPCSFPPLRRGGRGGGGRASADPERSIGRVGEVRARPGSPPRPPLRKGGKGVTESAAEDIPVKRKFVGSAIADHQDRSAIADPPRPAFHRPPTRPTPTGGEGYTPGPCRSWRKAPFRSPPPWWGRVRVGGGRSLADLPGPHPPMGGSIPRSATRLPTNTPARSRPTSSSRAARWSTAPARRRARADVAVRGDRIVAVGSFEVDPKAKVIDVSALVVAPGFIDLHTHSDEGIVKPKTRLNLNYLTQGVTTIVTGNCGGGALDVGEVLRRRSTRTGAGTNVIHLVPHGSLRDAVMGNAETAADAGRAGADEGARRAGDAGRGLGDVDRPDLRARPLRRDGRADRAGEGRRRHGGIYASHIRNEGDGLLEAIDEAIADRQGRRPPGPHLAPEGHRQGELGHGRARPATRIDAARKAGQVVTADQYPYIASSTKLAAMVVPHWAVQGDGRRLRPDRRRPRRRARAPPRDPARARRPRRRRLDPDRPLRARARVGSAATWSTIARREGTTPLEVVLDIQRHGGAQAISFGMSEDDVREVMRHDFVATASDGSTHLPGGGDQPHPRAYGTFPRKIRYALDEKVDHARAGDPLVLGPAGRDPRPARPRRRSAPGRSPTSSSSTRRPSATPPRSTSRPGTPRASHYLFVNGVAADRAEAAVKPARRQAARPGAAARRRTARPT